MTEEFALNATTVDGYHASACPSACTLLVLDENAKFAASVIGVSSPDYAPIANSDKVDGFDAALVATACQLLRLDENSKLPASITGDADTVDGFHAAAAPTACRLLALNEDSQVSAPFKSTLDCAIWAGADLNVYSDAGATLTARLCGDSGSGYFSGDVIVGGGITFGDTIAAEVATGDPQLKLLYNSASYAQFTVDDDATMEVTTTGSGQVVFYPSGEETNLFFQVCDGLKSQVLIVDVVNDRVGILTIAPDAVLTVNQGAGNPIADGWDTHPSTAEFKENAVEVDPIALLKDFRKVPVYEFTRRPFVSTNELVRDAERELGLGEIYDARVFLANLGDQHPVRSWIDQRREELVAERRNQLEYRRKHLGFIIDERSEKVLGSVLKRGRDGEIKGYSLNSYVSLLHGVILGLCQELETLQNRVEKLEAGH